MAQITNLLLCFGLYMFSNITSTDYQLDLGTVLRSVSIKDLTTSCDSRHQHPIRTFGEVPNRSHFDHSSLQYSVEDSSGIVGLVKSSILMVW